MFKLTTVDNYTHPVTVHVPVGDGKHAKERFTAIFAYLGQERIGQLAETQDHMADTELLNEILVGWDGVADETGKALPFTHENRDRLLDIPYVRIAVVKAYFESLRGPGGRSGN